MLTTIFWVAALIAALVALVVAYDRFGCPTAPKDGIRGPLIGVLVCAAAYLLVLSAFGQIAGIVFIALAVASLWNLPFEVYATATELIGILRYGRASTFGMSRRARIGQAH